MKQPSFVKGIVGDAFIRLGIQPSSIHQKDANELDSVLDVMASSTGLTGIGKTSRKIRSALVDGIQLGDASNEQLYWGAGLYE